MRHVQLNENEGSVIKKLWGICYLKYIYIYIYVYHDIPIFIFLQKYKWQKAHTAGKKVTSGMDLVNTLTNVVTIASTFMELNMVFVRSTNHGATNITGQNMLATATHLATTNKLWLFKQIRSYQFCVIM